ncbi:MAG TPA: hypothetical protein VKU37_10700, partial [Verrucomicrobiae bacterium]|nr:hypothetical protein [Verrucomicrobiae bacterium]
AKLGLRPGICVAGAATGRRGAAIGGGANDGESDTGAIGGGAADDVTCVERLRRSFAGSEVAGAAGAGGAT